MQKNQLKTHNHLPSTIPQIQEQHNLKKLDHPPPEMLIVVKISHLTWNLSILLIAHRKDRH